MSKITYGTKSGTITPALPDTQVWKDEDANEVKTVVNDNDDQLQAISQSGLLTVTAKLDLISGYFVNTAGSPITTTIPVNLTGSIQGGQAAIWYKGPVIDENTITGVNVIIQQGTNVANELCCVFLLYDARSNGVMVNILSGAAVIPPTGTPIAPASLTLTESGSADTPVAPISLTLTEGSN